MKPTYSELCAYVTEKGYYITPKRVFEHYEACSWKANGENIRNWKALVDTWEKKGDMYSDEEDEEEEYEETEEERKDIVRFIFAEMELHDDICERYSLIDPKERAIPPLDFVKRYTACYLERKPEFTYNNTEVKVNLERNIS